MFHNMFIPKNSILSWVFSNVSHHFSTCSSPFAWLSNGPEKKKHWVSKRSSNSPRYLVPAWPISASTFRQAKGPGNHLQVDEISHGNWPLGMGNIPPLMTGILISWGPINPKPDLGWWPSHPRSLYGNNGSGSTRSHIWCLKLAELGSNPPPRIQSWQNEG